MSKILGIDLGTGFSAMSIYEGGEAKIIANAEGARTTPSIVAWTKDGERLVGQAAKRQAVTNPKNTVYEVKRLIGRKYDEVLDDIKLLSYDVVKAPNGDCRIKVGDKEYSPEEVSSFILAKLKKDAEAYLGETVTDAIITVPAYFNNAQRDATKAAGTIAGLNVLRIINEPTAAALSYGVDKKKSGYVAVADAGSGTFDVSILEIGDGVFEVKATAGDSQLGGKDYDQAIMKWLIDEFKNDNGVDLSNDNMAVQRLKDESEKAKITLSNAATVDISLPFITANANGPLHLMKTLSRAKFEQLVAGLNDRMVAPCKQCIADAAVDKIDEVILVGGTTRIPSVQEKIKEIFGIEPSKGVNPDEVVSTGASIQGAVLAGDKKDILLLDVTPLTLAIETLGGIATPMIPRNTTIPTAKTQVFSTAADYQTSVMVRICQGERKQFDSNKVLGTFNLNGIPPAPRGVPQIEIKYDIDANGILTVTAKDLGTQTEQHITITGSSGLSDEEIEKAKKDAELHAEEDKKLEELVNTKNAAEALSFSVDKICKEQKDKLGDELCAKAEAAVAELRESFKTNDIAKIKEKHDALQKLNDAEIVPKIYPAGAQNTNNPNGPQMSKEEFDKMMNDPKVAEMFKNMCNTSPSGNASPQQEKKDDGVVDAEVSE